MADSKKRSRKKTAAQLKREADAVERLAKRMRQRAAKQAEVEKKKSKTYCGKSARTKLSRLHKAEREEKSLKNKLAATHKRITELKKETSGVRCKPRKKAAKKAATLS